MADGVKIAALPECLGAHMAPARSHEDGVTEQGMQSFPFAAAHEANAVAYLMHRDGRPLSVEILQFFHEFSRHLDFGAFSQDLELLTAADELTSEILAQHLEKFISISQECVCFFMICKNDLSFQCLLQRIDSPASFSVSIQYSYITGAQNTPA